jgi:hypothetical protein
LIDCLPWNPAAHRRILVSDSIQTDGRFLLHTLASQVLGSNNDNGRILWVSGAPLTSKHIASALKKLGCEAATSYLRNKNTESLIIKPLAVDMANKFLDDQSAATPESVIRETYQEVISWLSNLRKEVHQGPRWLILDELSSLSLDERVLYSFVSSIAFQSANNNDFGVLMRVSYDHDQDFLHKTAEGGTNSSVGWLGSGGDRRETEERIPWERSLEELVDGVVHVVPLFSGFSARDAHGRLTFSERAGGLG